MGGRRVSAAEGGRTRCASLGPARGPRPWAGRGPGEAWSVLPVPERLRARPGSQGAGSVEESALLRGIRPVVGTAAG